MQRIYRLTNPVQNYDWGSRVAIARLQGRTTPSDRPEAELWMGAHPAHPSQVVDLGQPLDSAIAGDPDAWLGQRNRERFGSLPFLFKVLAAARPLSLQAHPNAAQARAGFDAEERRGIPRNAPQRNYRDPNHKPELICALEPFEALCDFRPAADLRRLLAEFDVRALMSLAPPEPCEDSQLIRTLFTRLLELERSAREELVGAVLARSIALQDTSSEFASSYRWTRRLVEHYPGDAGVVVALMLNHLTLSPGQALYLDAGRPHAYLGGVGLEVMANSDNVLRGGLTSKHIDVPELKRVLRFEGRAPRVSTGDVKGGWRYYTTPATEFVLASAELSARPISLEGFRGNPAIVLCVGGALQLSSAGSQLQLTSGEAAFLRADAGAAESSGSGWVHVASVARDTAQDG